MPPRNRLWVWIKSRSVLLWLIPQLLTLDPLRIITISTYTFPGHVICTPNHLSCFCHQPTIHFLSSAYCYCSPPEQKKDMPFFFFFLICVNRGCHCAAAAVASKGITFPHVWKRRFRNSLPALQQLQRHGRKGGGEKKNQIPFSWVELIRISMQRKASWGSKGGLCITNKHKWLQSGMLMWIIIAIFANYNCQWAQTDYENMR